MEFLKYEGGEMKNGIWYENGDVYEKYGDDDHRATIDKTLKVTVFCDDGSYELPVAYYQGKDLKDSIDWANKKLDRRCSPVQ